MIFQNSEKNHVCWIMGRASFELHSRPKVGLFTDLNQQGHKIIKIVLSKQWKSLPSNFLHIENAYLVHSWTQVL